MDSFEASESKYRCIIIIGCLAFVSVGYFSSSQTSELLKRGEELNCFLLRKIKIWEPIRKKSIKMMRDTAGRNTNISRVVGAGTAIVGGLLVVAGSAGSFFTFGLAAPVAGIGIALAAGGGGTAAAASIADIVIAKLNLQEVQKQLDVDKEKTEELIEIINEMNNIARVINQRFPNVKETPVFEIVLGAANTFGRETYVAGYGAAAITYSVGKSAIKVGELTLTTGQNVAQLGTAVGQGGQLTVAAGNNIIQGTGVAGKITNLIGASGAAANVVKGGKAAMNGGAAAVALGNQAMNIGSGIVSTGTTAMNVGHAAMHVAATAAIALEVVLIPINIYEIVKSGMSLYHGSETKASHNLRENADEYETQMHHITTIIHQSTS